MQAVARESFTVTYNPACLSFNAREVLRQLRATKEFEVVNVVEESPYDKAFVARMQRIAKGKFTKRCMEDL